MGGKTWSMDEERLFWEVIVPQSAAAAYPDENDSLSWEQLADQMNKLSGANARRVYTGTMLYEHHYQNIKPGHKSPKAAEFVEKYLLDAAYFKEHGFCRPVNSSAPAPASEPLDPEIVELLQNRAKPKPKAQRSRKTRQSWERQSEDQPSRPFFSMPKTLEEIGAYSVTLGNAAQQQPSEGYTTPARAGVTQSEPYPFSKSALVAVPGSGSVWNQPVDRSGIDRSQISGRSATAFECTPKPDPKFLKQPAIEKLERGYWHSIPRAEQDQRSRETMSMAPGSPSTQSSQPQASGYASSWVNPGPSRQRTHQGQWDGRLPSIREMLPYEFGPPAYDPYAYEVNRRVDKRSFSNEQGYMQASDSTQKRRRLPDAPVRRQQDEQQQQRR
ncbi:hypothetical protein FLAG1_02127 [Fusarium langsethiae]|uniref:Uncharacterized protein n=1 Tax=Fusarium langsethiae TaxID=179993 RepID=A0A0N0DH56_FUSLA|nr:hypothetical protein FLAG1_02127 [Fusarium langsethiae]GKT98980.1 unnamed protein product [Fusarium langsethiae]GKU15465.1 unnamed protein product [Fusarium langsethiae]